MSSKEFVAAPVPRAVARVRRRSARGTPARSSPRCSSRARPGRTSARRSCPRSSPGPTRARRRSPGPCFSHEPARVRPRCGRRPSSQDDLLPAFRRVGSSALVTRSEASHEPVRVPSLHAQVALVHGRVERRAGRRRCAVARPHVQLAAHAAVRAHGPGPFVRACPISMTLLSSSAPVGQVSTHAPHDTHELSASVVPESGTSLVSAPRSHTCHVNWPCTSAQMRDTPKAVMHGSCRRWMYGCESSTSAGSGAGSRAVDPSSGAAITWNGLSGAESGADCGYSRASMRTSSRRSASRSSRAGVDCHAVDEGRRARRHRLRPPVDPDDAEAAGADGVEPRVVAHGGNVDADRPQRAENGLLAVDRRARRRRSSPEARVELLGEIAGHALGELGQPGPVAAQAGRVPARRRSRRTTRLLPSALRPASTSANMRFGLGAPDPAGRALAARLVGAEGEDVVHELGDRRVARRTRPRRRGRERRRSHEVLERQRDVEERRRDDAGQRAPHEDPGELAGPEPAAQVVDDAPERGRPSSTS